MDKITTALERGVDTIYPSRNALEKMLKSKKRIRLYQGFDPTGDKLHIGHMVGLMKLRHFQLLGHEVIFLIGDGTGQAGDPSGKTKARKRFMTREQLRKNAKDYVMQARKIIDFSGKNPVKILYNSDWLNKLKLLDILELLDRFSLQQLLERDIFDKRMKKRQKIGMREFIYPLLQGYDSVAMKVDLEIGGTDQTFNMLTGRKLVQQILGKEKCVLTLPLLADASGKKIGKTEGNVIALTAAPNDFYGMIMNLPDSVIIKCFEYITDESMEKIKKYEKSIKDGENPMIYKKKLAYYLVKMLNSESEAQKAQSFFETTFQEKKVAKGIPIIKLTKDTLSVKRILTESKLVSSSSEMKRLASAGAIKFDSKKISDLKKPIKVKNGTIIKIGKHTLYKLKVIKKAN